MQVTETLNDGLKRGYTITIPAAELAEKVDAKLREAQPEVEIKARRCSPRSRCRTARPGKKATT